MSELPDLLRQAARLLELNQIKNASGVIQDLRMNAADLENKKRVVVARKQAERAKGDVRVSVDD